MATSTSTPRSLDLRQPFLTREFRAAGLDLRRLRTKEFRRVFHDVYVLSVVLDSLSLRARAAMKVAGGRAHISHITAGELHDLNPPREPSIHVSVPVGATRCRADGIKAHLARPDAVVVVRKGIRVSSPMQTFLDLAGLQGMSLVDLVIVGDRLVAKRFATVRQLITATDAFAGRGASLARRAARLVRKGVDSPMETRLRLLIVMAGLPEPEVNVILRLPDGEWAIRLDLSYPKHKVIIEYDGRQHADSTSQWLRDLERREQLDGWGWRIVVVTAEGIFDDPAGTLGRVVTVLRARKVPGVPNRLSDEWRYHFTGKDL